MPNNEFIGRRVSVGVGIESTYGTEVAPAMWPRHMKLSLQRKTTRIENTSAMGRIEGTNDSAIVEEWAEGDLEGKVYDQSIGYLLYNLLGTKAVATNADASGTVKDHTFTVAQNNVAPSLTFARVDPLTSRRHGMATLDKLELTVDQGGWAMATCSVKAKVGTTSSDTAAYITENGFTSKHTTVKLATNVAGLSGATAIQLKNLKLTLTENATLFYPIGSIDPAAINTGVLNVEGEMTLRYTDSTLETLWFANTQQAMSITLKNTDVTIGTSANPALVFTLPKVRLTTFDMGDGLDDIVEQTVAFKAELDAATGYMIQAVLTNTKASY